jgi:hypothetical protein
MFHSHTQVEKICPGDRLCHLYFSFGFNVEYRGGFGDQGEGFGMGDHDTPGEALRSQILNFEGGLG